MKYWPGSVATLTGPGVVPTTAKQKDHHVAKNTPGKNHGQPFRYKKDDREKIVAAIIAALPANDQARCDTAVVRLEASAHDLLSDRARRFQISPSAMRDRLRDLLFSIGESQRLAIKAREYKTAAIFREQERRIAILADAYTRLAKRLHGGNFYREIYYFRVLSVWSSLGGATNQRYVRRDLERFVIAATAPVLGDQAPKASKGGKPGTVAGIVSRYRELLRDQRQLDTIAEFKADGHPVIADVDVFLAR